MFEPCLSRSLSLGSSGMSEITVAGGVSDLAFLSCTPDGKVDLWSHNDRSGRQAFHFKKTAETGDVYNITVSGGTNEGYTFLSCTAAGKVDLFNRDDGSGRQKWELIKVGQSSYNIKVWAGTERGEVFLSCTDGGLVDLYDKDDGSGRQKWHISGFTAHDLGVRLNICTHCRCHVRALRARSHSCSHSAVDKRHAAHVLHMLTLVPRFAEPWGFKP